MLPVIAEHIEIAPGVSGGEARIAGRGIKVRDVVIWQEKMGLSPREIVSRYPKEERYGKNCKTLWEKL